MARINHIIRYNDGVAQLFFYGCNFRCYYCIRNLSMRQHTSPLPSFFNSTRKSNGIKDILNNM